MTDEETPATVRLAFLPQSWGHLPTLEKLNAALAGRGAAPLVEDWSEEDAAEDAPYTEREGAEAMFFRFEDCRGFVCLMHAPFPWSDLEGPAATAWWWPEATEALQEHGAHLIVSLMQNPGDGLEQSLRLTRLVAAVLEATDSLAVYWPGGPLVQSAETFLEDSVGADREELPIHLWVDIRVFSTEEDTVSVFTAGLNDLGTMEIEIRRSQMPPGELINRVFGLAHYLAQNGPVIGDGHTVGGSADERILARHLPSEWEREGPVLVIEM